MRLWCLSLRCCCQRELGAAEEATGLVGLFGRRFMEKSSLPPAVWFGPTFTRTLIRPENLFILLHFFPLTHPDYYLWERGVVIDRARHSAQFAIWLVSHAYTDCTGGKNKGKKQKKTPLISAVVCLRFKSFRKKPWQLFQEVENKPTHIFKFRQTIL